MSIKTDAVVIRDETTIGANTATRVGTNLVDIADDLVTKQAAIDLNTAKETNTDTIYDDSDVLKDADTVSPVTGVNKIITESDVAALGGGDMLASVYDPIIDANTAKVGITPTQAADIVTNNAKVGVTTEEANPDVVSQVEAEAGVATTERIWTAQRVKQAIDALAGGLVAGDIDTLAKVNAIVTDATLIDVGDLPTSGVDFDPVGTDNSDDNAVNTLYSGLQAEVDLNTAKVGVTTEEANTIDSEPIGSEVQILQVVSITQAAYDLITPVATTLYVING